MFSFFNKTKESTLTQNTLLNSDELLELRSMVEQIDTSVAPAIRPDSRQAGNLATRLLGSGSDYAESRVYQPGDDPRSINWRLSARSKDTFVKTFHIESRPSLNIFLDKRRTMIFGTRSRLKVTQAVRAAVLLAYACEQHQINFQAWILDDGSLSAKGPSVYNFDNVDDFLLKANQACHPPFTKKEVNDKKLVTQKELVASVLHDIVQRVNAGSLMYFITDLADFNNSKSQSDLALIGEKSFVQVLHIIDQAELNLANVGKAQFQDMHETNAYRLNTNKKKDRLKFLSQAEVLIKSRKAAVTDLGLSYCQLLTDDNSIQTSISLPLGQS